MNCQTDFKILCNAVSRLFVVLFAVAVSACYETTDEPVGQKLVLDAWINTDGVPTAILTLSYTPQSNLSLEDALVRWGKVTFIDGNDTVILTGTPDASYFPPYKYTTYRLTGRPGRSYSIVAEYGELRAEARATMLNPQPIDTLLIENINDSVRHLSLRFRGATDVPSYYYVTLRDAVGKTSGQPGLCPMSCKEVLLPGSEIKVDIYRPKNNVNAETYIGDFLSGEEFDLNLCRVEREVYEYWRAYDNYTLFGNSQFVSNQTPMTGNVVGGYGIFSAQATSTVHVVVP